MAAQEAVSIVKSKNDAKCCMTALLFCIGSAFIVHLRFEFGVLQVLHMIVVIHLGVLSGLDVCYRVLPDKILLSAFVFAILTKAYNGFAHFYKHVGPGGSCVIREMTRKIENDFACGLLGAFLGFGLLYIAALIVPGSLGGGDVKMAGVTGFYLGIYHVLAALEVAFLLACAYSIPSILLGRIKPTDSIPLGLFLSMGTVILLNSP